VARNIGAGYDSCCVVVALVACSSSSIFSYGKININHITSVFLIVICKR